MQFRDKVNIQKEKVVALVLSIGITLIAFLDSQFLDNRFILAVWVILGIILSVALTALMMYAGFTVLKSFFLLGGEISLLIFLAQAYCDLDTTTNSGNDALRALVFIGIAYIGYEFFKSLLSALKKKIKSFPNDKGLFEKIFIIGIFLLFTSFFVWAIYQVSSPIIMDFCIYKR